MAASLTTRLLQALETLAERHVHLTAPAPRLSLGGVHAGAKRAGPSPAGSAGTGDDTAPLHEAGPFPTSPSDAHRGGDGASPSRQRPEPPAVGDRAPPRSPPEAPASSRR